VTRFEISGTLTASMGKRRVVIGEGFQ